MSKDRYRPEELPESAFMPRDPEDWGNSVEACFGEPREIVDQIHGVYRTEVGPDGEIVRIPDPDGNIRTCLRAGDLIEWLSGLDPETPILMDSTAGPEDSSPALFETLYAFDDPDPYLVVVARPYVRSRSSV